VPAPARAFPQRAVIEHWVQGLDVDGYGNPALELGATEEVPCNLQPKGTTEDTANQDQQSASWNLYLPAGVELGGSDRVVVGGLTLEAIGAGRPVGDFAGRPHHVEATLRRVV
jgi:hypothetical protein